MTSIERSLRLLIDRSPNGIFVLDAGALGFLHANRVALESLGYTLEELKSIAPEVIFPELTVEMLDSRLAAAVSDETDVPEFVLDLHQQGKDGERAVVRLHVHRSRLDGQEIYIASTGLQSEKSTRASHDTANSRMAAAEAIANTGSWEIDMATGAMVWSDQVFRVLGMTPGDLQPGIDELMSAIHPKDRELARVEFFETLKAKQSFELEHRIVTPAGVVRFVRQRSTGFYGDDGRAYRVVGSIQDITERKEQEKELAQFQAAIDASPNPVFFTNPETNRFLYVNSAAIEWLGRTKEELLKIGPGDLRGIYAQSHAEMYRDAIAAGDKGIINHMEVVSEDGIRHQYEMLRHALKHDDRWLIITTARDITGRLRRQDELMQFRTAMDALPDMVYITDRESLRFLYANRKAADMTGYTQEELLKVGPEEVLHADRGELERMYDEVIASGDKGRIYEMKTRNRDNVDSVAEIRRRALQLNGRWVIVTVSRDISDRKKAEKELQKVHQELEQRVDDRTKLLQQEIEHRKGIEQNLLRSEERFHDIAKASADGFWETDANLEFVFIDDSFREMTGISPERYVGLTHSALLDDYADSIESQKYLNDVENRRPFRNFQFEYNMPGGGSKYIRISGTPIFNRRGEFQGYRGAGTDVTSIVESEQRAIMAREQMRVAKEEAERANQAKTDFLASMSHELRTPMNSILGFAQLLELSGKDYEFTSKQKEFVSHILSSGEHLLRLIGDILELNSIEEGRISVNMEPVSIRQVVEDCVKQMRIRARERNIELLDECGGQSPGLKVMSDPTRLRQVLLNLMSNAIKYNRDGGSVTVSCGRPDSDFVRLSVADTGSGISPEHHDNLFVPFERLGHEAGKIEGTGIGLSIAKSIVELLGGNIGFETRVGEGSKFWIDIPLGGDEGVIDPEPELSGDESDGQTLEQELPVAEKTLLYVEDNTTNMLLMENIVGQLPEVIMLKATTAEEGITLARQNIPDLILMDINLPDMNGKQALKVLRNDAQTDSIPVIAVSADATLPDIEAAMKAGFNSYLTKPVNVEKLQATIREVFRLSMTRNS